MSQAEAPDMGLLTLEQCEALVMALGRGQEVFSDKDAGIVLDWAYDTLLMSAILELVYQGKMALSVKDGEVCFRAMPDLSAAAPESEKRAE